VSRTISLANVHFVSSARVLSLSIRAHACTLALPIFYPCLSCFFLLSLFLCAHCLLTFVCVCACVHVCMPRRVYAIHVSWCVYVSVCLPLSPPPPSLSIYHFLAFSLALALTRPLPDEKRKKELVSLSLTLSLHPRVCACV